MQGNDNNIIPIGFAMALSVNMDAMQRFSMLSHEQKQTVLDRARKASSASEMRSIADAVARM